MKKRYGKFLSLLCALALLASLVPVAAAAPTLNAGGWFESLYAELSGVTDSQITAVSYSGTMTGALTGDDFTYLVRDVDGVARIDIPGLKEGTYSLTVTANGTKYTADGISVMAYDRSGYAHQVMNESTGVCTRYTEGVGAYNDDGTLKSGAKVLYVTEETKDTVTLTATNGGKNFTVTGIGSILRQKSSENKQILKYLATNNKTPLVVRLVGTVTTPKDLSTPSFYIDGNGEWDGDNAYMADMASGANITIEGIGADAVMDGWGISFGVSGEGDTALGCGKNFEVRNLSFKNVPEDCVGIGGKSIDKDPVTHTWVHNCAFYVPHIPLLQSPQTSDKPYTWVNDKQQGDGAMDWKVAKYHTMSYNYFEGYHKTNLIGGGNAQKQYHATWHHNWWKDCESRGPLCRQTDIHIYNNLYDGNTSYCMSLRASCFVFSEYNTFLNCVDPMRHESVDDNGWGLCKSFQDVFTNCSGKKEAVIVQDRATAVTHEKNYNPYANFDTTPGNYVAKGDYLLDQSAAEAQTNIKAYAGPMKPAAEITTPGHVHAWSDWKTTKAATCTEAGAQTRTCSAADCPTGTQTQSVSPLGHNYENSVCTRCGDKKVAKTYTLTGDEVYAAMEQSTPAGFAKNPSTGTNPNSYVAGSAATGVAGTDNFFTLLYGANSRVDPSSKTFDDGYEAAHRVNFSNAATTTQNAVKFTTDDACTVKVWWVAGAGSDKPARSMVILNSAGSQVAKSAESSNSTETPMFSTLELDQGGTWYLGGDVGKNFIYKVEVTVGDPVSALSYTLDADKHNLTVHESVPAGETVWCAVWDSVGRFLDIYALTGTDPTASLPEGWETVKLIWLDGRSAPKCPAGLCQK